MTKHEQNNDEFILEKDTVPFLKIHTPAYYDMFWQAYKVEYLIDAPEIMDNINSSGFWEDVAFFNLEKKCYASYAIVGRTAFDELGRLIVRGEFY